MDLFIDIYTEVVKYVGPIFEADHEVVPNKENRWENFDDARKLTNRAYQVIINN